jgi:hypothetical protein
VSVSLVVVNVSLEVRLVSRQEDGGGGGGRDDTCKLLLHIGQPASESTGKEVACVCVCVCVCVCTCIQTHVIYIYIVLTAVAHSRKPFQCNCLGGSSGGLLLIPPCPSDPEKLSLDLMLVEHTHTVSNSQKYSIYRDIYRVHILGH